MLQANNYIRETDSSTPFEDYSIFMYRQSAPEFNDRVKELERKLLYPVSTEVLCAFVFVCSWNIDVVGIFNTFNIESLMCSNKQKQL